MRLDSILAQITQEELKIPKSELNDMTLRTVLQIVGGAGAAIAIIVITVAGLQFVLSAGNPQSAAKAKNAIIYAVIGLVISVFAFGIASFVLERI